MILSCLCYVDHGDLPVLTHSFPTRRSSDRTQVTDEKADVAGFKLSPDGTRLLVWGDVPRECTSFGCDAKDKGALVGPGSGRLYKDGVGFVRSEEHTSELQSLMRISYAVFCLKNKNY